MWRRPVGRSPVRIIFSVFIAIKFVATKLLKIALTAKYAAFAFEKRGKCGRNIARKACFLRKKLCGIKKMPIFAPLLQRERAFSSAGSEHLPYKQRVGGSNPSTPTKKFPNPACRYALRAFSSAGSEHLPYKQRVGGSNPSTPTNKNGNRKTVAVFILCRILQGVWHIL